MPAAYTSTRSNSRCHGTSKVVARLIYPVTEAVTAAVLICPPPEPFGTLRRIEPLFRLMVRVPPLKLKIV